MGGLYGTPDRCLRVPYMCAAQLVTTEAALATAGQLAAQLGVTDRAARRYIAILREAGIPVESTRGPYGGYGLGRGIRRTWPARMKRTVSRDRRSWRSRAA